MGVRVAELSAFWIVNGMPRHMLPRFLTCLDRHFRGQFGDLNHGRRWLDQFSISLGKAVDRSLYANHIGIMPALGIPSDVTRIIDGVSTRSGESFFVVIHLLTSTSGQLYWQIVGLPNVAFRPESTSRTGSVLPKFSSHGAERLVALVHHTEAQFNFGDADRRLRLALTVADGAIEGPSSINFAQHEANVMNVEYTPACSQSCEFHAEDHAGADTDKTSPLAPGIDQLPRLVCHHFGFGSGQRNCRAVAREFAQLMGDLEKVAASATHSDKRAEQQRVLHAQQTAHTLRCLRWHVWRVPLAPQLNGTRKVVYASRARIRHFENFPILYWAVRVSMAGEVEKATAAAVRAGKKKSNCQNWPWDS